mmetsp:Transcript_131636/g.366847  ORF Transcript_131636/g.366847 Transcript_131636/m.366847 type:complete len:618 (-) Transcript_131636:115-1968(-)
MYEENGLRGSLLCEFKDWLLGRCASHHHHELLKVDVSIAVAVETLQQLGNCLGTCDILDVFVVENDLQLILRDFAIAVLVEDAESRPADVLLQVRALVQRGRQELGVVNDTAAIGVDALQDLLQVQGDILQACLGEALLHLGRGEQPVAVAVQGHKGVAERLDLVLVQLVGDDVERRLLELVLRAEAAEVVDEVCLQRDVGRLRRLVLDPLVVQGLLGRVAVPRVHLQHHADQILRILRDVLPVCSVERKVAQAYLGEHLGVSLAKEGWVATQHHIHDDAATPYVAELVVLAREHLGRNVIWRARLCRQHLAFLELAREAEIDDLEDVLLDGVLRCEQEVLGLEITVADVQLVHVVDRSQHLLHDDGRLALLEVALLYDAVEELPAGAELRHQVVEPFVLKRLDELEDVWVVQGQQYVDLLLHPVLLDCRLGDVLERSRHPGALVNALGDRAVASGPQDLGVHLVAVLQGLLPLHGDRELLQAADLLLVLFVCADLMSAHCHDNIAVLQCSQVAPRAVYLLYLHGALHQPEPCLAISVPQHVGCDLLPRKKSLERSAACAVALLSRLIRLAQPDAGQPASAAIRFVVVVLAHVLVRGGAVRALLRAAIGGFVFVVTG